MAREEVRNCDKCGQLILPEPELGDRQGGPTRIVHGATTWAIDLCSECKEPLWDLYREHVPLVLPEGTATGAEKLEYLPVKE